MRSKDDRTLATAAARTQDNPIVASAVNWLLTSGIQNATIGDRAYGSFNAWYEQDTQSYPFVYSEITGYLTALMCYLWERTGDERYLRSATRAGDWLLRTTYEPNGGFRCLYPLQPSRFDFKQNQMYAFDNGVIVNGLINLYRATKQEKYLASAVTAADWLVYAAQKATGGFHPVYQLDRAAFFESDEEWSMSPGSYHAKIAIGLLNLYDLTQKQKYLDSAIRACDFAIRCQEKSGRFITFPWRGGTNTHPHCYTAEGLWGAGTYLGRDAYLDASARGIAWVLDLQSRDGYVPRLYLDNVPIYHERVDAICQTLRLAILHRAEGRLAVSYEPNIERLLGVVRKYQAHDGDPKVDGGFYFGCSSDGKVIPHLNVWVTAFAVQALLEYGDYRTGRLELAPFRLV